MADFVKLDGYNVKDALAGKSLSISGDQLSLLKADGTAASTVTIPAGSKYAILTLSDVGSDIVCTYVDSSEASMGFASALIDLIKAGGIAYVNYNGEIYEINSCLDGNALGVSGFALQAESNGYGYTTDDVSDFSLVNSVWTAITPSSGGSAASVLVLADASQWPLQSNNNLLHLIYQGDTATLLAIRNLYNSAVIPVSAYCITVNNGGGGSSHYTDLTALVDHQPVGTYFDLDVWLVEGIQSSQQHKITFAGVIDTGGTITLQSVSNFTQASLIGA